MSILTSDIWYTILQYCKKTPIDKESYLALNMLKQDYDLELDSKYDIGAIVPKSKIAIQLQIYKILYNKDYNLIYRLYSRIRNIKDIDNDTYLLYTLSMLRIIASNNDKKMHIIGLRIFNDMNISSYEGLKTFDVYPLLKYSSITLFIEILANIEYEDIYKCIPFMNKEQIEFIMDYDYQNKAEKFAPNIDISKILKFTNAALYLNKSTYDHIFLDILSEKDPYVCIYKNYINNNSGGIESLLLDSTSIELHQNIENKNIFSKISHKFNISYSFNIYYICYLLMSNQLLILKNKDMLEFRYLNDDNVYIYKCSENKDIVDLLYSMAYKIPRPYYN